MSEEKKIQLEIRAEKIADAYEDINELEHQYFEACRDYAMISVEMINSLRENQNRKKELKKECFKTMAEFEREYELSGEFLILKSCKYQLEGYDKLIWGTKVRLESLKAEVRGER